MMRFWSKLSLLIVFLIFPSFLPSSPKSIFSSKSIFCLAVAWSSQIKDASAQETHLSSLTSNSLLLASSDRDFGDDGRNGTDGRSGRSGRDGENRTIFANGSPVNLELSGESGEDGENGKYGEDADCERQPLNMARDLRAASGGKGGDGGSGGNGGNGGLVTVYYTNPADLRQIYVRSQGARGGRGGRGARGGDGCECEDRSWEIPKCTGTPGTPGYSCKNEKYSCQDGRDGPDGRNGSDGRDGSMGTLTLINRSEALPEDRPTVTLGMPELQNRTVSLSLNQWETKSGATSLLASGSIISDRYREFVTRLEGSFELVWNANRSITDFYNQRVSLTLKEDRQVHVSLPEDIWFDGTTSVENGLTRFVVSGAILESEATKLTRADFAGSGQNLTLSLVDLAGKSDLISTQFLIKYRTTRDSFERFSEYTTRYEGNVPADLVTQNGNRFTLNLGKLPINSQFLQSGLGVEIELVAIRAFGGHSTQQKISWRGEIKR